MSRTITVKMAKPSQEDCDRLHRFLQSIETIVEEGYIDPDNNDTLEESTPEAVMDWLDSEWAHVGHVWQRVLWAGKTAIDNCCDPNADVLEWHPKVVGLLEAAKALVVAADRGDISSIYLADAKAAIAAMEGDSE